MKLLLVVTTVTIAVTGATPALAEAVKGADPQNYLRTRAKRPDLARELLRHDVADSVQILTEGPEGFLAPESAYPAHLKRPQIEALRTLERRALVQAALLAVVEKKHQNAVSLVTRHLTSDDAKVRADAAERLGATHGDVVATLVELARTDADADVRAGALIGLGHHRSEAAFEALVPFFNAPREEAERAVVVKALKLLGSEWAWQARGEVARGARLRARVNAVLTSGRP